MSLLRNAALASLILLMLMPIIHGQMTALVVVVTDESGKPITNASVEIYNEKDALMEKAKTNNVGRVDIDLAAGVYIMVVSARNYKSFRMPIQLEETWRRIDVTLEKSSEPIPFLGETLGFLQTNLLLVAVISVALLGVIILVWPRKRRGRKPIV